MTWNSFVVLMCLRRAGSQGLTRSDLPVLNSRFGPTSRTLETFEREGLIRLIGRRRNAKGGAEGIYQLTDDLGMTVLRQQAQKWYHAVVPFRGRMPYGIGESAYDVTAPHDVVILAELLKTGRRHTLADLVNVLRIDDNIVRTTLARLEAQNLIQRVGTYKFAPGTLDPREVVALPVAEATLSRFLLLNSEHLRVLVQYAARFGVDSPDRPPATTASSTVMPLSQLSTLMAVASLGTERATVANTNALKRKPASEAHASLASLEEQGFVEQVAGTSPTRYATTRSGQRVLDFYDRLVQQQAMIDGDLNLTRRSIGVPTTIALQIATATLENPDVTRSNLPDLLAQFSPSIVRDTARRMKQLGLIQEHRDGTMRPTQRWAALMYQNFGFERERRQIVGHVTALRQTSSEIFTYLHLESSSEYRTVAEIARYFSLPHQAVGRLMRHMVQLGWVDAQLPRSGDEVRYRPTMERENAVAQVPDPTFDKTALLKSSRGSKLADPESSFAMPKSEVSRSYPLDL